jgi:predicted TIM-barrel fold metal-dependent hydrolase
LWLPPAPREAFRIDDLDSPLERFSDLNFQIVHAGMAFLDQTREMLVRHPNLYATLESTFAYSQVKPRLFAEILGGLLQAGGSDHLLYASGANLMHPRPLLDAFETFEMPRDLVEERGYPEVTVQDRRNILGENVLRLHGIEPLTVADRTAGDAFDLGAQTLAAPWSGLRQARV